MSWSISKMYRSPQEAMQKIDGEGLPKQIVDYIGVAALELQRQSQARGDTEQPAILVHGYGHLCHEGPGGGNYEVTTAKLAVLPIRFGVTLTLPLQVT